MKKKTTRNKVTEVSSRPQIRDTNPQGPMTSMFQNYMFRKVSGEFYEMLREGIPIIDSGIRRLISLNGTLKPIGDKMDCVEELEDFCRSVPVNDTQAGIHAFYENTANETFEQGFSYSEFTSTPDLKDIAGLRVADSKDIIFRRNDNGVAEPWYRYPESWRGTRYYTTPEAIVERIMTANYGQSFTINGFNEVKLNPSNKIYFSIGNENSDPHGVSKMRSMEFTSKILVTLQNSIANSAERFGDPMYHGHVKTGSKDLEAARKSVEDALKVIVASKRVGGSGDIVTATGNEGDVTIKVIGHEGQLYTYDIPLRHVLEQIVSGFGLPAWMLGIYWSTTERMATLEVESALQDAKIRQLSQIPQFIKLFSTYLLLRGKKWKRITTDINKPGDWGFIFETPNLRDLVAQAQARFLNSQADMMQGAAGNTANTQTNITVGAASVEIGGMKVPLVSRSLKVIGGEKELQRPMPWPELDKIEAGYEAKLKESWADMQYKIFTVFKLNTLDKGQKDDIPSIEAFNFTPEQRAAIMDILKDHIGMFDFKDTDSAVRWYYGQAYSAGLLQAVKLIGKERPVLDIIKNREIYDELCKTGFELVKDNLTKAIVEKIIPEMERQMLAGTNPRHVADRLEKLFGDQNSDWERLSRSEMSMAAEGAKLNEWNEWGIDTSKTPVPVKNTHPRCRCSITIEEKGGKFVAVFMPAPDACTICLALVG